MIEVIKHALGFCGEHWHPNIWTAAASFPFIGVAVHYVKCKCGRLVHAQKELQWQRGNAINAIKANQIGCIKQQKSSPVNSVSFAGIDPF